MLKWELSECLGLFIALLMGSRAVVVIGFHCDLGADAFYAFRRMDFAVP